MPPKTPNQPNVPARPPPGTGPRPRHRPPPGTGPRPRGPATAKINEDTNLPTIDQDINNKKVDPQEGLGCGRHTLNNFLGNFVFGKISDAKLLELDNTEKKKNKILEQIADTQGKKNPKSIDLKLICAYVEAIGIKSVECSDNENYDINVLMFALYLIGYKLERIFPGNINTSMIDAKGILINEGGGYHWLVVRQYGNANQWRRLNSIGQKADYFDFTDIGINNLYKSNGNIWFIKENKDSSLENFKKISNFFSNFDTFNETIADEELKSAGDNEPLKFLVIDKIMEIVETVYNDTTPEIEQLLKEILFRNEGEKKDFISGRGIVPGNGNQDNFKFKNFNLLSHYFTACQSEVKNKEFYQNLIQFDRTMHKDIEFLKTILDVIPSDSKLRLFLTTCKSKSDFNINESETDALTDQLKQGKNIKNFRRVLDLFEVDNKSRPILGSYEILNNSSKTGGSLTKMIGGKNQFEKKIPLKLLNDDGVTIIEKDIKLGNFYRELEKNFDTGPLKVVSYNIENRVYAKTYDPFNKTSYYTTVSNLLLPMGALPDDKKKPKLDRRAEIIAAELEKFKADIICLQECHEDDFNIIKDILDSEYEYIYNKDTNLVIFFLNKTITINNDSIHPAISNEIYQIISVKYKAKDFLIVNAHLPQNSYLKSIKNIQNELKKGKYNSFCKLVCGDFNNPDTRIEPKNKYSKVYDNEPQGITNYKDEQFFYDSTETKIFEPLFSGKIDYIFHSNNLKCENKLKLFKLSDINKFENTANDTTGVGGPGGVSAEGYKYGVDYVAKKKVVREQIALENRKVSGLPNAFRQSKDIDVTDVLAITHYVVFPSDHMPLYAEFDFADGSPDGDPDPDADAPPAAATSSATVTEKKEIEYKKADLTSSDTSAKTLAVAIVSEKEIEDAILFLKDDDKDKIQGALKKLLFVPPIKGEQENTDNLLKIISELPEDVATQLCTKFGITYLPNNGVVNTYFKNPPTPTIPTDINKSLAIHLGKTSSMLLEPEPKIVDADKLDTLATLITNINARLVIINTEVTDAEKATADATAAAAATAAAKAAANAVAEVETAITSGYHSSPEVPEIAPLKDTIKNKISKAAEAATATAAAAPTDPTTTMAAYLKQTKDLQQIITQFLKNILILFIKGKLTEINVKVEAVKKETNADPAQTTAKEIAAIAEAIKDTSKIATAVEEIVAIGNKAETVIKLVIDEFEKLKAPPPIEESKKYSESMQQIITQLYHNLFSQVYLINLTTALIGAPTNEAQLKTDSYVIPYNGLATPTSP